MLTPSKAWRSKNTRAWRRVRLAVLDRDKWICQLCKQPIDPRLKHPHPMSAQVHHTLGRAVSGDDPRYLVAAHRACNVAEGEPGRTDPTPTSLTRW